MIGLIVLGVFLALVTLAWLLARRTDDPTRRWDDPGQSEAFAAAMLSKIRRMGPRT